jgi:hypothetical protein
MVLQGCQKNGSTALVFQCVVVVDGSHGIIVLWCYVYQRCIMLDGEESVDRSEL